jgi:predicted transcriptional regulator
MLSKMLMVGVKDLVVKELINKGFSEQEIKLLLLKEKIKNL